MSISRQASSEPEPPNVVSVKSRTSRPLATVTWRSALAWFHAEISRMPVAVRSSDRSSFAPSCSSPSRAASTDSGISPPSRCGGIRPRMTWASVTVGWSPPFG